MAEETPDAELARLRRQVARQQEIIEALGNPATGQGLAGSGAQPRAAADEYDEDGSALLGASAPQEVEMGPLTGMSAATPQTDEQLAWELHRQEESAIRTAAGVDRSPDADFQLAMSMQQTELAFAQRANAEEAGRGPEVVDPLWGKFTPPVGRTAFRMDQVICIACCPCCMRPCCSTERKAAWKRLLWSASFVFSVIQLATLILSLCFRGFAPREVNPMLGPWPDTLSLIGAKNDWKMIEQHQLYRLVTPVFLHAGLIHIATNLLIQLRFAIYMEVQWGTRRFIVIYLLSGITATLASALFMPQGLGVGASGALMGVFGAWAAHIMLYWGTGTPEAQQQRSFQLLVCFLNVAVVLSFSMVPYIDWAAHVFGLLGGLAVGSVIFRQQAQDAAALQGNDRNVALAPAGGVAQLGGGATARTAEGLAALGASSGGGSGSGLQGQAPPGAQFSKAVTLAIGLGWLLALVLGLVLLLTVIDPAEELSDVCRLVMRPSFPDIRCKGDE